MVGLAFKIQRRMGKSFVMSQSNHMRAAKFGLVMLVHSQQAN